MDKKEFILQILQVGLGYVKALGPILASWLIGLHMKQPRYMRKNDANDH